MINDDNTVTIRISKDLYDLIVERSKREYIVDELDLFDNCSNLYDHGFSDGITDMCKSLVKDTIK